MASSKKNDVISVAPPHSIKKFELISEYVKAWIQILMLTDSCKGIVYIDLFPDQISTLVKNLGWTELRSNLPEEYQGYPSFNF